MFRFISIVIFLFSVQKIHAQKVQVFDLETKKAIPNVAIYTLDKSKSTITNKSGQADLFEFNAQNEIKFQHVGYETKIIFKRQLSELKFKVYLKPKKIKLDEFVVSANKFEENKTEIVQQIESISANKIAKQNPQTSADILQSSGNILVQKSQAGGGSPILRGFEANKVLLVIDGIRMNNAIYRSGHLQNAITIDNAVLERVEVIFGPGSVIYGSDALGGVVHYRTKNPKLSLQKNKTNFGANVYLRYANVNHEKTAHIDFNLGFEKWGFLTSITASDFEDLRQGKNRNDKIGDLGKRNWYVETVNFQDFVRTNNNPEIQKESAYSQIDFLQKIAFQQSKNQKHIFNFQYSISSDIPRYDRLTVLENGLPRHSEWYYGPQKRFLGAYHFQGSKKRKFWDKMQINIAHQRIEESRVTRLFQDFVRIRRVENVNLSSLNIDFQKKIKKQEINYGAEIVNNEVKSTAGAFDIRDLNIRLIPPQSRYPGGGSQMNTSAIYLTDKWKISEKLILTSGIRFSTIGLNSEFTNLNLISIYGENINRKSQALNGSLGFIQKLKKDWRISFQQATGFRAPNVDDLAKVFESIPGSVIVPNPNLNPEYLYSGEMTIAKTSKKHNFSATGFLAFMTNRLVRLPFQFQGKDSIVFDGEKSRVLANQNAERAYIYGFNLNYQFFINKQFDFETTINYTYGRILTDSFPFPLDHIPPIFGKIALNYQYKKWQATVWSLYNSRKKVEGYNPTGSDKLEFANPDGLPAWMTINIRTAYQINQNIKIQFAIENILDKNYRIFASGISAPGRNLILTIRGKI